MTKNFEQRIPDRRSAAGMVMRAAKPVQRMPQAKLLGAAMGFAEPHGHVGAASLADALRDQGSGKAPSASHALEWNAGSEWARVRYRSRKAFVSG
jgi:hypothetical protein